MDDGSASDQERRELRRRVRRGLDDVRAGRLHDDEDVWRDVDALIQTKVRSREGR